jgi:1,2-diacylglycerol 3-beta-glucosyltransferase
MPEHSWPKHNTYMHDESNSAIHSLMPGVTDVPDSDDVNAEIYEGLTGRRRKAAVALSAIWGGTVALHLISWGVWVVLGLTAVLMIHALRVLFARPAEPPLPLDEANQAEWPYVSLMVAAKNEEAVIASLVKALCQLDYPSDRYDVWVIDDYSTDRTPEILDALAQQHSQLQVLHRPANAGGGKSGALNDAYRLAKGEILAVFDADAQVPKNLLRRVLPLFQREQVGAVQVRKAIAQVNPAIPNPAANNFWVQGQACEMALDSFLQQRRVAVGGIGELRGNGQFVRRRALERCGGWNEETITDDLDLTLRLHLDDWDIDFLAVPAVQEEGVTRAIALWHQRNRWAEGGVQRYLDYWHLIRRNQLGTRKTIDLAVFLITQYLLPAAAVPDFLMATLRSSAPIMSPIAILTVGLSLVGMCMGIVQIRQSESEEAGVEAAKTQSLSMAALLRVVLQSIRGTLYMFHWFIVIGSTNLRISVRPKRLKWVKTSHQGIHDLGVEVSPPSSIG